MNSDLQIASPQVSVDIDRDRALALGVTPEQIQNALYTAYGDRQVSNIYAPANQYSVILEVQARRQARSDALSKLYIRSTRGSSFHSMRWRAVTRTVGSAERESLRPASCGDDFVQSAARAFRWAKRHRSVDAAVRELRIPVSVTTSFQGTVKEFQESFREPDGSPRSSRSW